MTTEELTLALAKQELIHWQKQCELANQDYERLKEHYNAARDSRFELEREYAKVADSRNNYKIQYEAEKAKGDQFYREREAWRKEAERLKSVEDRLIETEHAKQEYWNRVMLLMKELDALKLKQ